MKSSGDLTCCVSSLLSVTSAATVVCSDHVERATPPATAV